MNYFEWFFMVIASLNDTPYLSVLSPTRETTNTDIFHVVHIYKKKKKLNSLHQSS